MKVLLLEDDPDNAYVLTILLQDEGYTVDCVGTCKAALDCLHANQYDIALIDLCLPDKQGLETFDAIHGAAPSMPIVILSALDDPATAVEALKRGANFYLVKSVEPDRLLDRMVQAMAQSS